MNAPTVHVNALELRRHACLEHTLLHVFRDARPVVENRYGAKVALAAGGDIDMLGTGIARVPEHLDDDILGAANIVLGLAPLGLRHAKTNIAFAEVLLNSKATLASHGGNKTEKT